MNAEARRSFAALLIAARKEGRQIGALDAALVPATHAEGYQVNAQVTAGLGWVPLGWKIAGTTPQMRQRLRTPSPIYGRTFEKYAMVSPARLRHADLLDPLIECEFFFRLGRDLPPRKQPYARAEVADAIATVHAGVEIAECRFPRSNLPPMPAIVADGAASGRYVVGPAIPQWRQEGWLGNMAVTLTVNGRERRKGSGRDVMGDPINPLIWLANERSIWGDGLKAGELISTGTATGMLLGERGDKLVADFGGRYGIEIELTAA